MVSDDAIKRIAEQLKTATTYSAVFGPMPTGSTDDQRSALRKSYGYLVKLVHPDKVPEACKQLAHDTFIALDQLRDAADQAIQNGTYDQPLTKTRTATSATSPVILQSSLDTYQLEAKPAWTGDFSVLYPARALTANRDVIIKITADPRLNAKLEWEARLLARFNGAKAKPELAKVRTFVPHLLDTFMVGGTAGKRYRANVTMATPGMFSLTDILRAYPNGLDPRDAAWIFRRILGQTLAAAMTGVVHGAIIPDHVLVDPIKHEPLHLGWIHAIEPGQRISTIINRWREFYPPEVFKKQAVDHRTDLYMAGQTMIYLLGGDTKRKTIPPTVPKQIAQIILQCVADSPARRPSDGRAVLDDFTRVIKDAWGRVYRPLPMPAPTIRG